VPHSSRPLRVAQRARPGEAEPLALTARSDGRSPAATGDYDHLSRHHYDQKDEGGPVSERPRGAGAHRRRPGVGRAQRMADGAGGERQPVRSGDRQPGAAEEPRGQLGGEEEEGAQRGECAEHVERPVVAAPRVAHHGMKPSTRPSGQEMVRASTTPSPR
jgi:hypothetical protein